MKIPEYTEKTSTDDDDLLIINDSIDDATKKLKRKNLLVNPITTNRIKLTSTDDVNTTSSTNAIQIGESSSANMAFDANEIMARNNGSATTLYLNAEGGTVQTGGDLGVGTNIELGHASDTTLSRISAGKVGIEGKSIVTAEVLFYDTATRTATISSAYTNFNQLVILYYWVDTYGTITLDCVTNIHKFSVVRTGLIDAVYKIQVGAATITLSGTSVTGSTTGSTYTIYSIAGGATGFSDAIGELKIARVIGLKW